MRIKSHVERNPIKLSQVSTNAAVNTHAHLGVGDVIGNIKLENIKSFSFRDGETALCAEIRSINGFCSIKIHRGFIEPYLWKWFRKNILVRRILPIFGFLVSLFHPLVKTFRGWVFPVGWLSRLKWVETTLLSITDCQVVGESRHPTSGRMRMNFERRDDQIWQIWSN